MRLYNFFEASASFELGPLAAIQYFLNKGLRPTFAWQDMVAQEHDVAFTVAKMLDTDLLAHVDKQVEKAIVQGTTLAEFKEQLIPTLQRAGWWGRGDVIDPATGKVLATDAQLGSAWRLETIFRSNLQSAYSVGTWTQIQQ
ncbi:phage head morphogenesis protein, partial [Sansalvadorimonas verongulae]